jgi:hypothetical protein
VIPSAGGEQETVLLERRLVHAWLLSIDVDRIKPELQAKLIQYQEECAKVLDDYFTKGHANNPRIEPSHLPTLYDPMYQTMLQLVVDLDATKHELALLKEREHARDQDLIATQQKVIEGFLMAERAEAKADVALEDLHRMTVEEYVIKNGLMRQYRPSEYPRMSKWLSNFCQQWGLEVPKAPVLGKSWDSENAYPLQAFAALARYEQKRPQQITLVKESPKENTNGNQ